MGAATSRALVAFVLLLSAGCTGADPMTTDPSSAPTNVVSVGSAPTFSFPPLERIATLDYEQTVITTSLDRFGMSLSELQVVEAARSIVFARCVTGIQDVSETVLREARRTLQVESSYANHWLFGRWNAPWLASRGLYEKPSPPAPVYVDASPSQYAECVATDANLLMEPISVEYYSDDVTGQMLYYWYSTAYYSVIQDSRFAALKLPRDACLSAAGYSTRVDDSGLGGLLSDSTWSEEQQLAAYVVAAQCNDTVSFVQQAADIMVEYQLGIIDENEAELLAIRAEVELRVERAHAILREVGLE